MPAKILQVNPVIPAIDMPSTIRFWERMGFLAIYDSTRYGEEPINYVVMRRDNLCVHLQHFDDIEDQFTPHIKFQVQQVGKLLGDFKQKNLVEANLELRKTPWGTLEFAFFDPNRIGLTFFESV